MTSPIDRRTLDGLSRLARLALDDDDRARLEADLSRMLELFDALAAVPVDGVEPMSHPHAAAVALREDVVRPHEDGDALLALAPDARGGFVVVPAVIEG